MFSQSACEHGETTSSANLPNQSLGQFQWKEFTRALARNDEHEAHLHQVGVPHHRTVLEAQVIQRLYNVIHLLAALLKCLLHRQSPTNNQLTSRLPRKQ